MNLSKIKTYAVFALASALLVMSCKKDEEDDAGEEMVVYDPTPYVLNYPAHIPPPSIPEDNQLTVQGVRLGKMLFHEPLLSADGSQSCASCHDQTNAFSDTAQFSIGVNGLPGGRQAMAVMNMAWNTNGFFWDGRAPLLRDQSLLPIQDELEMDETLENVISKLSNSQAYKDQFTRAFGDSEINALRMSLAMEQFMNSIVSFDSKYDRYLAGIEQLTESEERGRQLYFTEFNPFFPDESGADCEHCHGGGNFENDEYMNNGLDAEGEFEDDGFYDVTGNEADRGKFKVTSLRNIALTPPYMHDGRFNTLEEVIEHYNEGIQSSASLDPALEATIETGLMLDDQDIQDLVAFLHTLTDINFTENPEYQAP
ncbi:cytochrome-c peroxidase [Sanyastnella coralliicola]|uniref:cytochrome-c peroxidase n=1 Tax=Sanyastnella coralliicola TaxID=3069118 RepID=UPI0027B8E286|nr:cytochrome c peroxidase [Longitalea sp. SCSIO 12813]